MDVAAGFGIAESGGEAEARMYEGSDRGCDVGP